MRHNSFDQKGARIRQSLAAYSSCLESTEYRAEHCETIDGCPELLAKHQLRMERSGFSNFQSAMPPDGAAMCQTLKANIEDVECAR